MPTVDVSSLVELKPLRMPVLSPRHTSSTSLAGSYRSTLSRPYYGTSSAFASSRVSAYSERIGIGSKSTSSSSSTSSLSAYTVDDSSKKYSRHASICEDRPRRESATSTLAVLESVADLRSKYSPANYVPAVLRQVTDACANSVPATATNNKTTATAVNAAITAPTNDSNGNRTIPIIPSSLSVAEIRKQFDAKPPEALVGGNKYYSRPAKCCKINDVVVVDAQHDTTANATDIITQTVSNMWSTEQHQHSPQPPPPPLPRPHNHTTNFASYIPAKDYTKESKDESTASDDTTILNDISASPRLNRSSISQGVPNSVAGRSHGSSQGLTGLKNIGNTCFMNSVLQCLSNTRQLLEYVRSDGHIADINTSMSSMRGALIKAFAHVVQELWAPENTSSGTAVNTSALKTQIQRFAPRFMGYAQQDAQEFLRYLLEGLHEDVNRVAVKPAPILTDIDDQLSDSRKSAEAWQRYLRADNSRVVDIFVGQLKSTLRCTHCGHCSVTFDPFWDLSLPVPSRPGPLRLSQCLEHFTREETLDGDEKPTCSKCKERRKCTKSFSIQRFPRVLVIHLKRFSPTERFRGKLNVLVDFPLSGLDLSAFAAASTNTESIYSLYAVSNHSGTTYSGHYTAYCKHPYTSHWHEYNDSRVSPISAKNVVSSEAYVLFYELITN